MASPAPAANGVSSPAPPAQANPPAPAAEPRQNAPSQSYTAPTHAATSLTDPGTTPRPRDARTIHMVLASLGVHAYQERVPLQLLDFAYRYTQSILSDAQHLQAEGYLETSTSGGSRRNAAGKEELSLNAVRAATASRQGYQFSSTLPKETLLEIAAERNRVRLPDVGGLDDLGLRGFGLRLPHERFVLSGADWGLLEEWDSEGDEEDGEDDAGKGDDRRTNGGAAAPDAQMNDDDGGEEGEDDDDDDDNDEEEGFEAVFGGDGDQEMNEG